MFPPTHLTPETVYQVTERVWLTKPYPNVRSQWVRVCLQMEDGTFVGFSLLEMDDRGVYRVGDKVIGTLEDSEFIKYLQKISRPPAEEDEELFTNVRETYAGNQSIKKTAKLLSLSEERVRRILITLGLYTCDQHKKIMELLQQGKTIDEISGIIRLTPKQVNTYLPYRKEFE